MKAYISTLSFFIWLVTALLYPITAHAAEGCEAVAIRNTVSVDQTSGKPNECVKDKNYQGKIIEFCPETAAKGRRFIVSPDPSPLGTIWCEHGGNCWIGKDLKVVGKCRFGIEYSR